MRVHTHTHTHTHTQKRNRDLVGGRGWGLYLEGFFRMLLSFNPSPRPQGGEVVGFSACLSRLC